MTSQIWGEGRRYRLEGLHFKGTILVSKTKRVSTIRRSEFSVDKDLLFPWRDQTSPAYLLATRKTLVPILTKFNLLSEKKKTAYEHSGLDALSSTLRLGEKLCNGPDTNPTEDLFDYMAIQLISLDQFVDKHTFEKSFDGQISGFRTVYIHGPLGHCEHHIRSSCQRLARVLPFTISNHLVSVRKITKPHHQKDKCFLGVTPCHRQQS